MTLGEIGPLPSCIHSWCWCHIVIVTARGAGTKYTHIAQRSLALVNSSSLDVFVNERYCIAIHRVWFLINCWYRTVSVLKTQAWNLYVHQGWKKPRFFRKKIRFLGFFKVFKVFLDFSQIQCTNKNGHKISTQEEHPIHNPLSFRSFSVKYNKTHKSWIK